MFIHFLCLCPPRLAIMLNLIYRKWPIGCKGVARGETAVNDLMLNYNVIYSNLKAGLGKATKTGRDFRAGFS